MNEPIQSPLDSQKNRRISLGIKLPLSVIGLLFIAGSIFTVLSIRLSQKALTDTLNLELQDKAAAKVEVIQSDLLIAQSVSLQLASFAETESVEEADLIQMIRNTLKRNERIFGSTIAFESYQFKEAQYYYAPYFSRSSNNILIFTDLGTPEYDYLNKSWYKLPKDRQTSVLSAPYFDAGGGDIWMVTWSTPFFDEKGAVKGIATADIAFLQTQEIVNSIEVGKNGYAFLMDKNGILLGIGSNGGEYKAMSDSMVIAAYTEKTERWIELVAEMREGKTGFIEATDPRGEQMLVAYSPIGLETGWSLALAYPKSELVSSTNQLRNTLLGYSFGVLIVFSVLLFAVTRSITEPLQQLREFAGKVSSETLSRTEENSPVNIEIKTQDELEDLGNAFNQMSNNLREAFGTLEEKVESRTKDLTRLTIELQTIAEVNRELAIIRDQKTLMNVSANLIRERLGYYHVGIFLVDDKGEFALLRGASSNAAEEMLANNYKLSIEQTGLVANVIRTGYAYIAQDVDIDSVHLINPYLPNTHSEIVLPLRSYNITIGALDIQSTIPNSFDERDMQTLQILADHLTAAIENAELAQKLELTVSELSKVNQLNTKLVWQNTVKRKEVPAFEYDGLQIHPIPNELKPDLITQLENGSPITVSEAGVNTLYVPLTVLREVIGVIGLVQENPQKTWNEEQISIAQAAANRAALTLENARLFEESNRRANKESTIFSATRRIGNAVSMENILQTTAEELGKVLSGSEITIQFTDREYDVEQEERDAE
ncbi:MAG: GAF domain-containing protein [Anaerolineales bacterium]|nr:GAF domain-containing protein [Anaerolineales bacterium]MCB9143854.1 GAF domain-containing protein [Anaerolineales bacterium]